jgi:hypothetical protein
MPLMWGTDRGHSQCCSRGLRSEGTINGQDGRLVCKGNWLICEPMGRDAMPVQDARAEAYRLYDEEMANAWRNPQ